MLLGQLLRRMERGARVSEERWWRWHTDKPPGAVSKCPPSSLPAGPAVMGGEVTVAGRCWFSHRRHFSNWKIEASLSGFFPGVASRRQGSRRAQRQLPPAAGIGGPPGPPATSSAPARPPPQPQVVITHHSGPGLSCCRHGDGIPPSSRK